MRRVHWSAMLLLALPMGCATMPPSVPSMRFAGLSRRVGDSPTMEQCSERMARSVATIRQLRDFFGRKLEFLLPREHDRLEQNLAEYLSCRYELERIARNEPRDSPRRQDSLRGKTLCDVELVSLSVEDPVLWRAMNQSFHRSRIPGGSCDRILHEVTAVRDPSLPQEQRDQIQRLISRRGVLLPEVENELHHAPPAEAVLEMGRAVSRQVRRCQNVLVASTGRIRNPAARPLTFSDQQRQQIQDALQPGDVLLTYTAGNASNLFIPGNFKHAATFVGTPAERRRSELPPERLPAVAGTQAPIQTPASHASTAKTGKEADVVESLAEGVQFCNFQTLLTTRINRLVVLRPQLNPVERAEQIADVLSYVGDEYDFSFDLTDASDQVCTEVVYRSLQGRGGIDLPLSEHAGRLTLTADDILKCSVRERGQKLACILVVDESRDSPGSAKILRDADAQQWLSRLPGIGQ